MNIEISLSSNNLSYSFLTSIFLLKIAPSDYYVILFRIHAVYKKHMQHKIKANEINCWK